MAVAPKVYKFPKSMGACADRLFALKTERLKIEKQAAAVEAEEKALKDYIIDTLPKGDEGAVGKTHKVQVIKKLVPRVENWTKLHAYIKKTGNFDLLQKRVLDTAVIDRWDAKKEIPGVVKFQAVTVSLTKA